MLKYASKKIAIKKFTSVTYNYVKIFNSAV
jgi:hypothetical protein